MLSSYSPAPPKPRGPWGFWATLAFSFITWLTFSLGQFAIMVIYVAVSAINNPGLDTRTMAGSLLSNGFLLALGTILAMFICLIMIAIFVAIRNGPSLQDYLGLRKVVRCAAIKWVLVLLAVLACSDGLSYLLGRPTVHDFMFETYHTAGFVPLLFFALLVAAPLSKEILFRGFLFRGLAGSRLGVTGAILLTAGTWALLHIQYDWYGVAQIFALGLLLGYARHKTGSTSLTIALHVLANLVATGELLAAVYVFK